MEEKPVSTGKSASKLFILTLFFIIGLLAAYIIQQKRAPKEGEIKQEAKLDLLAENSRIPAGEDFKVTLILDSGKTEVAAADFVVAFDPKYLKVTSVSTGNFFANYPINVSGSGYVKVSGVATFDGKEIILPKGKETVAEIVFQATENKGKTEINFDRTKTIVATNGINILDPKRIDQLDVNIL
ncbi:MAG: hypothetical protein UV73_C0007G0014 [Candidatus Gottesmanbacteria bacterium GW2011_GWA2_43_14]|uniref:Cohesin domain-containing protein n=1 Tax=Candidatus Gottesmanbacteria bacterium GW2011_GWA2_43_14 TaxID=1618443 RepID=A0A0G1FRB1_9BACT|nr:MAG: hypothetical protein UV73_C0007G0014 [Candidatus Gottesmanbacteria bacterium GW2011_GWA2_43_14]